MGGAENYLRQSHSAANTVNHLESTPAIRRSLPGQRADFSGAPATVQHNFCHLKPRRAAECGQAPAAAVGQQDTGFGWRGVPRRSEGRTIPARRRAGRARRGHRPLRSPPATHPRDRPDRRDRKSVV